MYLQFEEECCIVLMHALVVPVMHERITRASHGAGDVRLDPFNIEQFGENHIEQLHRELENLCSNLPC